MSPSISQPRGPHPRIVVAGEFVRAVVQLCIAPFRFLVYLVRHGALSAAVARDLDTPTTVEDPPPIGELPDRPLRVFVSCAEHSGEIHALSLVRELGEEAARRQIPLPFLTGLGGERLRRAKVDIVGDPVSKAAMGSDVLAAIPFYYRLLAETAAHLRRERPDVVVMVDSPALHVPLGRIAKRYGIPVLHFVTPQYWGWAPWRVGAYARAVDLALSILPFEPAWFRRHRVRVAHVGHPLLDHLADRPAASAGPDSQVLVLLPGSRAKVIHRNLPWMLVAASRLRLALPDLEVVIPAAAPDLAGLVQERVDEAMAQDWVHIETGDLHATLDRAGAALSVSGTVLLDLLHHRLPTVVIYRVDSALAVRARRWILTVPYFASVNLLAGREVLPEYCFRGDGPIERVSQDLLRCYTDEPWRASLCQGLDEAATRLGPPGAARRAALHALSLAFPA